MSPNTKKDAQNSTTWTQFFLALIGLIFLILSLSSYHPEDPSLHTFNNEWSKPMNWMGYLGSWSSDFLYQMLGLSSWMLPVMILLSLLRFIKKNDDATSRIFCSRWWVSSSVILIVCTLSLHLNFDKAGALHSSSFPPQGLLGYAVGAICLPLFGDVGSLLFLICLTWAFVILWWKNAPSFILNFLSNFKIFHVFKKLFSPFSYFTKIFSVLKRVKIPTFKKNNTTLSTPSPATLQNLAQQEDAPNSPQPDAEFSPKINESSWENDPHLEINKTYSRNKRIEAREKRSNQAEQKFPQNWICPPTKILKNPVKISKGQSKSEMMEQSRKIHSALSSFDIDGEVVEISPGPIITMFEFQPAPGTRVQKIVSVSTDLAMALGVPSVRIVAPIPGKSVAGIEVPNTQREDIVLRDVYENTLERSKFFKLPLILGKDAEGKPIVEDLSRMPHLLVGGATNMGKSVLVNSILTGLLCRFTPEQLRLIIVDPKLVEFKIYEDIPHLLLPVVNDASDASQALKWAVAETKRRYVEMQKYSAKNLESYNERVAELSQQKNFNQLDNKPEHFPYIVIIVDELAELMLTSKKDVEQSIVRLTQLARAAGIHLIMATQRPSADVVTGLIKSNCPSRASLRVASASDSRIILDCSGAEVLLGRGDMFFTNSGPMGLRRIQGCFVSDEEVDEICNFWRDQGEPEYHEEILSPETTNPELGDNSDRDSIYNEVVDFAREKGKISTSLIQRRFQVGYTRAARIMEQLEETGIVGEAAAAGKARDVIL